MARPGPARFVLWILALVALALGAVAAILTYRHVEKDDKRATEMAVRDNENLARALEEGVRSTFANADTLLWSIKNEVESAGLPDDLRAFVAERTLPGSPVLLALVTDERGVSVRNTHSDKPIDISHRKHFRENLEFDPGRLTVGDPARGRVSGKWSVHVSRRINRADGSFGGVATAALDQSYFSMLYRQVMDDPAGFVMLLGKDGIVRAHDGQPAASVGERIDSMDLLDRIARSPSATFMVPSADGEPARVVSYRALQGYPLAVVVATSLDHAFTSSREHRANYVGGVVVLVALIWIGCALLAWINIRQRRATLQLRAANRRAEAAHRAKSDFLADMTHELRTPLNGIIGFADCLQDELADEAQRRCASRVYENGCSLLGMVNAVLDMAKIEAGRMAVRAGREPLRPLLQDAVVRHARDAEGKGLALALAVADDVPQAACLDRDKVEHILAKLVNNAIASTASGTVSLLAGMRDGALVLGVQDTGCGLPGDLRQAIVARFDDAQRSGVGLQGGEKTGLGLALASDLARLMGGWMEVDSEAGKGSTFRLVLPQAAEAAAAAE